MFTHPNISYKICIWNKTDYFKTVTSAFLCMLHTYAWMPLNALFSSHAVHDPYVVISLNYPQSISHISSSESSPRSDSLKNIHLRLAHAPISHMSPLQGTLPPAHKSAIICVFRSQALCGSDWLTDRWQAVLLLHLLSVQITATCSVITVCKGCGSLANDLTLCHL